MSAWDKLINSNFIIKLFHWEYWPFGIIQFPLFFYYPWLSLKAGSFTFFTGSNPGILMGGMFGESKYDVLRLIPGNLVPKTILVQGGTPVEEVAKLLRESGLSFPLIFKPDIGERGYMVKRIDSEDDIAHYLRSMPHTFLAQEFADLPMEFGVFYARRPMAEEGTVVSIVVKEMLHVTGDGISTLKELIFRKHRAKLQWKTLAEKFGPRVDEVVAKGEKLEIVSIGNHALGTKFLNGNHLITPALCATFDRIAKSIPGFYFGRFDLRCASVADLSAGNVKILELNGCGAEPAHIYDPDFPVFGAISVLLQHWRWIYEIARENHKRGVQYLPIKEAIQHYHTFKVKTKHE
jgi:hypothetical protein